MICYCFFFQEKNYFSPANKLEDIVFFGQTATNLPQQLQSFTIDRVDLEIKKNSNLFQTNKKTFEFIDHRNENPIMNDFEWHYGIPSSIMMNEETTTTRKQKFDDNFFILEPRVQTTIANQLWLLLTHYCVFVLLKKNWASKKWNFFNFIFFSLLNI